MSMIASAVNYLVIVCLCMCIYMCALSLSHSLMFWTDYGDPPTIERARMDGTGRATIVQRADMFQNLDHPNDIAIDFDTELLYFADGAAGIVAAVTFNGNGRVILNKFRDNPSLRRSQPVTNFIRKPKSLTLRHLSNANRDSDENTEQAELFWSDPEFHGISAVDLVTTGRRTGGIEHSNLRSVLPRTTDYKPMAVQFVSLQGHKPGGECGEGYVFSVTFHFLLHCMLYMRSSCEGISVVCCVLTNVLYYMALIHSTNSCENICNCNDYIQ